MIRRNLRSFLLAGTLLLAALPSAASPAFGGFKAGDRWCAVGDSITNGGQYHSLIYLFYATRFPTQRFEMFNCGIAGDSAAGTLKRLDTDILPHQPTVASVMLGMNDVKRHLYTSTGDGNADERQKAIDGYVGNMRSLLERLKGAGARLIVITPSIFDQTALLPEPHDAGVAGPGQVGVNTGLGKMAEQLRAIAGEFGAEIIDFHGPMSSLNAQRQKQDPAFTLIGQDRVHPGAVGHMVMAYHFLKAQEIGNEVSAVDIDAAAGRVIATRNGTVAELKASSDTVSFRHAAEALPFPVVSSAKPALELVPFQQELNMETLRIRGLSDGSYQLRIDGKTVATFNTGELSAGVNLASIDQTPQYQQAVKVHSLNDQRRALITERLRCLAMVESAYLAGEDIQPGTDVAAILDRKLEPLKNQSYYVYVRGACDAYLKFQPVKEETLRKVGEITDRMWQAAAPVVHAYEIIPAASNQDGIPANTKTTP
jgi:lysophospholipase L1-like esterase